jgi:type I restriction enzyme S subunit
MIYEEVTIEDSGIEIIDGDRGKNYPKKNELLPTGYCVFLNTKNIVDDRFVFSEVEFIDEKKDSLLRKGKLQRGDFVITTRGTVGNVAYYSNAVPYERIRINSGMVIVRNNNVFDPRFLYLLLKSPYVKSQFTYYSSGSAQPQLPIRDLKKVKLIKPKRKIQEKIADILGSLDDKIELNRRMNETLEQMAMALYKHWFGEGEQEVKFSEIIEINPAVHIKKGAPVPFVDMKALPTTSMSVQREDIVKKPFTSGSRFMKNDILFARITPCLENGKTAFVDFLKDSETGFGSTEFLVFRAKHGCCPQFVYCLARDEQFRQYAIKSMVGWTSVNRLDTWNRENYAT